MPLMSMSPFGIPVFGLNSPFGMPAGCIRRPRGPPVLHSTVVLRSPAPVAPLDVIETDSAFIVNVEVPGFEAADIAINLWENVLTVSAGIPKPAAAPADAADTNNSTTTAAEAPRAAAAGVPEGGRVLRRERVTAPFRRSFPVPRGVDADCIEAALANGVLELTLPKAAPAPRPTPTRIPVNVSAAAPAAAAAEADEAPSAPAEDKLPAEEAAAAATKAEPVEVVTAEASAGEAEDEVKEEAPAAEEVKEEQAESGGEEGWTEVVGPEHEQQEEGEEPKAAAA